MFAQLWKYDEHVILKIFFDKMCVYIYIDLFIILPLLRIKYKVIEGIVYWCIGPS